MDNPTLKEHFKRKDKYEKRKFLTSWWIPILVIVFVAIFLGLWLSYLNSRYPNAAEISSWMQVIVEITLIPIVILGFWLAYREFNSSRSMAEVMVLIGSENEQSNTMQELKYPEGGTQSNFLVVALNNYTDIRIKNWKVSLFLPKSLWGGKQVYRNDIWKLSTLGELVGSLDESGEIFIFHIRSNGGFPLQSECLDIGSLYIPVHSDVEYQDKPYRCRWAISGERVNEDSGWFEIIIPTP
jgi:hypothetical protein